MSQCKMVLEPLQRFRFELAAVKTGMEIFDFAWNCSLTRSRIHFLSVISSFLWWDLFYNPSECQFDCRFFGFVLVLMFFGFNSIMFPCGKSCDLIFDNWVGLHWLWLKWLWSFSKVCFYFSFSFRCTLFWNIIWNFEWNFINYHIFWIGFFHIVGYFHINWKLFSN